MDTEIPIDRLMEEQDPSQGFARQPQQPQQEMSQQEHAQMVQQMAQQQMAQQPVQGLPMPAQQSALGKVKEFMGQKSDYIMAIPIFLVVVAVFYFMYPKLATFIPALESAGRVLVSVLIGILVALIYLLVKYKTQQ